MYRQNKRDRATALGLAGIVAILVVIAMAVMVAAADASVEEAKAAMDGSDAGANAVEADELESMSATDEWEEGMHSVTIEDLEQGIDADGAYPTNGKGTPLVSDTTYGKGGGMVDVVTFDSTTNVMVRHYGQIEPDGRVRWYAAETVLDADGKPMAMPRN